MDKNKELQQEAWENTWRIEKIFHLGVMTTDYAYPSELTDALDDLDERFIKALGIPDSAYDGDWERDSIVEWLNDHNKLGWLITVATPIRSYRTPDSCTHSWGYYMTQWIYGDTYEQAIEQAKRWVIEQNEKDRAESLKSN